MFSKNRLSSWAAEYPPYVGEVAVQGDNPSGTTTTGGTTATIEPLQRPLSYATSGGPEWAHGVMPPPHTGAQTPAEEPTTYGSLGPMTHSPGSDGPEVSHAPTHYKSLGFTPSASHENPSQTSYYHDSGALPSQTAAYPHGTSWKSKWYGDDTEHQQANTTYQSLPPLEGGVPPGPIVAATPPVRHHHSHDFSVSASASDLAYSPGTAQSPSMPSVSTASFGGAPVAAPSYGNITASFAQMSMMNHHDGPPGAGYGNYYSESGMHSAPAAGGGVVPGYGSHPPSPGTGGAYYGGYYHQASHYGGSHSRHTYGQQHGAPVYSGCSAFDEGTVAPGTTGSGCKSSAFEGSATQYGDSGGGESGTYHYGRFDPYSQSPVPGPIVHHGYHEQAPPPAGRGSGGSPYGGFHETASGEGRDKTCSYAPSGHSRSSGPPADGALPEGVGYSGAQRYHNGAVSSASTPHHIPKTSSGPDVSASTFGSSPSHRPRPSSDSSGLSHDKIISSPARVYTSSQPYSWEIAFEDLDFGCKLGEGAFGEVYAAEWRGSPVAVKMMHKSELDKAQIKEFMDEADLMVKMRPHANVVQLFGVATEPEKPFAIVVEYLGGGSVIDVLEDDSVSFDLNMALRIARGTAAGMNHLASERIFHRDLAARNLLLTTKDLSHLELLNVKIADFGMSKLVTQTDSKAPLEVVIKGKGPIKWMAPESLLEKKFSEKSDVWSFGIVLYELFSRQEPYPKMDIITAGKGVVLKGLRPKPPALMPEKIREIMNACLRENPEERPPFKRIFMDISAYIKRKPENFKIKKSTEEGVMWPGEEVEPFTQPEEEKVILTIRNTSDRRFSLHLGQRGTKTKFDPKITTGLHPHHTAEYRLLPDTFVWVGTGEDGGDFGACVAATDGEVNLTGDGTFHKVC